MSFFSFGFFEAFAIAKRPNFTLILFLIAWMHSYKCFSHLKLKKNTDIKVIKIKLRTVMCWESLFFWNFLVSTHLFHISQTQFQYFLIVFPTNQHTERDIFLVQRAILAHVFEIFFKRRRVLQSRELKHRWRHLFRLFIKKKTQQ